MSLFIFVETEYDFVVIFIQNNLLYEKALVLMSIKKRTISETIIVNQLTKRL